ncbi:hypothetical protein V8G54_002771 [Vigna mungo]|uniref:Transposase MuDR plant domain-containing protein n=1 Tax=Vigna mungo TaxID=3915 RepID=A0AAQ3SB51_VIGMU
MRKRSHPQVLQAGSDRRCKRHGAGGTDKERLLAGFQWKVHMDESNIHWNERNLETPGEILGWVTFRKVFPESVRVSTKHTGKSCGDVWYQSQVLSQYGVVRGRTKWKLVGMAGSDRRCKRHGAGGTDKERLLPGEILGWVTFRDVFPESVRVSTKHTGKAVNSPCKLPGRYRGELVLVQKQNLFAILHASQVAKPITANFIGYQAFSQIQQSSQDAKPIKIKLEAPSLSIIGLNGRRIFGLCERKLMGAYVHIFIAELGHACENGLLDLELFKWDDIVLLLQWTLHHCIGLKLLPLRGATTIVAKLIGISGSNWKLLLCVLGWHQLNWNGAILEAGSCNCLRGPDLGQRKGERTQKDRALERSRKRQRLTGVAEEDDWSLPEIKRLRGKRKASRPIIKAEFNSDEEVNLHEEKLLEIESYGGEEQDNGGHEEGVEKVGMGMEEGDGVEEHDSDVNVAVQEVEMGEKQDLDLDLAVEDVEMGEEEGDEEVEMGEKEEECDGGKEQEEVNLEEGDGGEEHDYLHEEEEGGNAVEREDEASTAKCLDDSEEERMVDHIRRNTNPVLDRCNKMKRKRRKVSKRSNVGKVEDHEINEEYNSDDGVRFKKDKFQKYRQDYMNKSFKFELGMEFCSLKEFKNALMEHIVLNGKEVKFVKNDLNRVRAICKNKCGFLIMASKVGGKEIFRVKTLVGRHRCGRVFETNVQVYTGLHKY